MNKNNGLTDGERLVCVETKLDTVIDTQAKTTEKLDKFIYSINKLLPSYITRIEMSNHSADDNSKFDNLRKANKLQIWLTGIMGTGFGAIMMYLITFYMENKK